MPIFRLTDAGLLRKLKTVPLDKEKKLQSLVEANLFELLELRFLASEYTTTLGGRIDTLAVDLNGSPVIIEYKRNRNDNVINQALSYLKWLKTQKIEFFQKLVSDKLGASAADIDVDWKSPRVICIAESYSPFDIDTVEVVPLRIELFRYRFYQDDVFALDPVNVEEKPDSVTSEILTKAVPTPSTPAQAPSVESHLASASPITGNLFILLREQIKAMDENVTERVTNAYVAFRASKNFAEVHLQKARLRILLRDRDYDDPRGLLEKLPDAYNWSLNRQIYLKDVEDLSYVLGLVEQSYQDVL